MPNYHQHRYILTFNPTRVYNVRTYIPGDTQSHTHLLNGQHPVMFHLLVVSRDEEGLLSGPTGDPEEVAAIALVRKTAHLCLPVENQLALGGREGRRGREKKVEERGRARGSVVYVDRAISR